MKNRQSKNRITLFDIIFIIVLSVFSVCTYNTYKYHDLRIIGGSETFLFIAMVALFFFSFLAVLFVFHTLEKKGFLQNLSDTRIFSPDVKGFFKGTLLIFLCYLPIAVIFYPGVCSWDTINQLNDFLTGDEPIFFDWIPGQEKISASLNDHHPVFDTLIYVCFYNLGIATGHLKLGIFAYSLTCMVCTSGALSYMFCLINKLNVRFPKIPLLLFVLIMPVYAVYSFSMIKDSLFGMVFVWYFCVIADILLNKPSQKKMAAIIVLSVLLSLTNKKGVYIAIPSGFALLFSGLPMNFKYKKFVFPAFIVPAVLMMIILPKIIFPIANVWPGGKQEMYGTLFQQSARVEIDKPDYYSEDERRIINKVIDFEHIKDNYRYEVSDGIKDTYRLHCTDSDRKNYLKVWFKTGIKNPVTYLKATAGNSGGFFSPTQNMSLHKDMTKQVLVTGLDNIPIFDDIRNKYLEIYDFISNIPVIHFLFSNVLYTFWIPLFFLVRCFKKKRSNLIILSIPILLSLLLLIVSPNSHIRYGIQLFYLSPFLTALSIYIRKNRTSQLY